MNKIELSPEERDFFALVAANLKDKGLTQPANLTLTNVKLAILDVKKNQDRLAETFCNNEELAQAIVVKLAKAIYDGMMPVKQNRPRYETWTETDLVRFLSEYLDDDSANIPGLFEGEKEDHYYAVELSSGFLPCSEICVRFHCGVWQVHVSEDAVKRNGWKCPRTS